jgi:hypothetical protein
VEEKSEKSLGGRPTKYKDIDLDKVKLLAEKGWTDIEMSDFFEVSDRTWYRWKGEHDEFCQALSNWKENSDSRVERSLYERATGYTHKEDKIFVSNGEETIVPTLKHYPPDSTAMIFWLKNRQPKQWRDKRELDATVNHKFSEMSDSELDSELEGMSDD